MDLEGARKVDWDHLEVSAGDRIVLPSSNCCLLVPPPDVMHPVKDHSFAVHAVASTVTGGTGFYSHLLGVAPYVFGLPPDEVYSVSDLLLTVEYR